MKVLICSINSKYIHSSLAPWCLASGLEKYGNGTECKVLECTINETEDLILDKILNYNFDLIGFCTYIWNANYVEKICKMLKERKNSTIVLGGPEAGFNVQYYIENEIADYVISGEGEEAFAYLCRGDDPKSISGVSFKNGDEIVISQPASLEKEPLNPYSADYFENINGRIVYFESSRGCPFNCAFCLSGRKDSVRFFNMNEVKENIIKLANCGTQTIKFVDRTFNANKDRANEIFEFIISNYGEKIPKGVCFHFEIEATLMDDKTIKLLKNAPKGAMQFEIGIQSFNSKTLEAIHRKRDTDKVVSVIKSLCGLGNIHIHIDLIAGLPYEDMPSFEKSFNLAYSLKPNMLQLGFLKMLHGSYMRENPEIYPCEFDKKAPYQVKSTPWLSSEDMQNLHTCEDFFEKIYNSSRFSTTCEYLGEKFENAFKMYFDFAMNSKNKPVKTLDELTLEMYNYFGQFEFVDKNILRDAMAMDRLATNRMGTLPEFLKIHSDKTKKILNELEKTPETKRKQGVKRAITLLSNGEDYVYVDYDVCDPVSKRYKLNFGKIGNI